MNKPKNAFRFAHKISFITKRLVFARLTRLSARLEKYTMSPPLHVKLSSAMTVKYSTSRPTDASSR